MVRTHDPAESKSQMAEDELKSTEMLAGDLFATLAAAMMKVNYIIQTTIRGRQLIKLSEIFVETYLYSYQADKSTFILQCGEIIVCITLSCALCFAVVLNYSVKHCFRNRFAQLIPSTCYKYVLYYYLVLSSS